jgi:hypothetical protein
VIDDDHIETAKYPGTSARQRSFSPHLWMDIERNEHVELRNKLLTLRHVFSSCLVDAGGKSRALSSTEIMALVYERLNPARSEKHPVPRYEQDGNPRELALLHQPGC